MWMVPSIPSRMLLCWPLLRGPEWAATSVVFLLRWVTSRISQGRLTTPRGASYSGFRRISRGLPGGGAVSPFPWLVHFSPILAGLRSRRPADPLRPNEATDCPLLFAGDIACLISHRCLSSLKHHARHTADAMPPFPAGRGL